MQSKERKCLTAEQEVLKRWNDYYSYLYTHESHMRSKRDQYPPITRQQQKQYLKGRDSGSSLITKEREITWNIHHGKNVQTCGGQVMHDVENLQQNLADRRMSNSKDSILDYCPHKKTIPNNV